MTYRDDLEAAQSRADAAERERVKLEEERARMADELSRATAARDAAVTLAERLKKANAKLERERYAPSRGRLARVVLGLAVAAAGALDLIQSWSTANGEPPLFGLEAGPVAAAAAVVAAILIGGRPFLPLTVVVLGAMSALLISKPYVAPVMSSWSGGPYGITSETHLYFIYSGVALLVVLGLIGYERIVNRPRKR